MAGVRKTGSPDIGALLRAAPIVLVLLPGVACALEMDYGIAYAGVYSDNIGRTPTNEQQDWINIARGNFVLQESTDEMTARVFSEVEFRQYMRETFGNELRAGLDGSATWAITPRRLTFTVEDRYTQAPVIPGFTVTPANLQNTNVFSLGPNGFLHFTNIDHAEIGGRYSNLYYQSTRADSNRWSAYAGIFHELTPVTTLSAHYDPSLVDYTENQTLNPDYTRQDIYASGRNRRPTMDLTLDAGRTFINRRNSNFRDVQGHLLRATFTRRLTSDSTLNLAASDTFSEAGRDGIVVNPLLQITPSPTAINTTDFVAGGLYAVQQVDAGYIKHRTYGLTRVSFFWRDLDFESPQLMLDQRVSGAFADIGVDYSTAFTTAVFGNYSETRYHNVYREDKDYGIGARVIYRYQRTLSFMLEGRLSGRDSTLNSMDYGERRVVLTVSYDTNYGLLVQNPFLQLNNPLYR